MARQSTANLVTEQANGLAADLLEPLVCFLAQARTICGGDADKVLLMAVIALRANLHADFRRLTPAERASSEDAVFPSLGVNYRSLSRATGIPPETVRRKVTELVELGWVARDHGRLHYTHAGYLAMEPVRDEIADMAARMSQTVDRARAVRPALVQLVAVGP